MEQLHVNEMGLSCIALKVIYTLFHVLVAVKGDVHRDSFYNTRDFTGNNGTI